MAADPATAEALGCAPGAALFTLERTTWKAALPITWVRLAYPPGHRLTMDL
jgi:GntR family histidine utilization transcriptional repressor